jgi:hypothetical protein
MHFTHILKQNSWTFDFVEVSGQTITSKNLASLLVPSNKVFELHSVHTFFLSVLLICIIQYETQFEKTYLQTLYHNPPWNVSIFINFIIRIFTLEPVHIFIFLCTGGGEHNTGVPGQRSSYPPDSLEEGGRSRAHPFQARYLLLAKPLSWS